jgi:hypothetical protein
VKVHLPFYHFFHGVHSSHLIKNPRRVWENPGCLLRLLWRIPHPPPPLPGPRPPRK